jgi:3-hydroxyacyl-CoA dehydrogenase / enoyl-CoA hydratase / 3-hydroxybutyryl-CoA epimerase
VIKTEEEKKSSTRHLNLKQLESGLLLIKFDSPQKANQLTSAVMTEFEEVLNKIEQDPSVKAVGLMSAKPDSFLLGADLREIMQLKSEEAALNLVSRGQAIFARFAALKKPTIAGVHGLCLGGGLEVILCCHKRIATSSKETVLGLPETKLGFVPGLGGTQRLPRLIGVKNALDLILSAEPISAARALEIQLVDQVVLPENLETEMEKIAKQLISEANLEPVDATYGKQFASLDKPEQMALKTARRSMRMITKGNYPALLQVIDVIEEGLTSGLKMGLREEAKTFAQLAVTEVSRNLVFLFFNAELVRQSALAAVEKEHVTPVKTIGIIGGGMMGTGLAKYLAEKGFKILFRSFNKSRSERAFASIKDELDKNAARKTENGTASTNKENEIDIEIVLDDQMFSQADIIIEATEENASTKINLFKHLENIVKKDCLLATITSSLSVTDLASQVKSGASVIGAHFFHPVDKMPLVEVALPMANYIAENKLEQNYRQSNAKLLHFIAEVGKTPLSVKDSSCFLVNRLLASYLLEAARLAEAGVPLSWIDKVATDFGMPLGALTLLDEVGIDVALLVADALAKQFPERIVLPTVLRKVTTLGMKGKRFGCGIYMWDANGKRLGINPRLIEEIGLKDSEDTPDEAESAKISAALILPMVDEAAHCLQEKVVRRAREVDIGCVLGLGFPAFRGGVLKYADSIGLTNVVQTLNDIYSQTEPRRIVSSMLTDLVQANGKFYS